VYRQYKLYADIRSDSLQTRRQINQSNKSKCFDPTTDTCSVHFFACWRSLILFGVCVLQVCRFNKLHWLRARKRITFKLCLLVYKAINGLAPSYLQDLWVPVTTVSTRAALRSAARGDLVVPRTRRRLGNRAFCVAGPTAWNSLPPNIRTAPSLTAFKNLLKTHLFIQSYYAT